MKVFLRFLLLVLVSVFAVSCAVGPGQGRGPRRGPTGQNQMQPRSGGTWTQVADGTYSHYRVGYNKKTRETRVEKIGDVPNTDPGLLADAHANGYRVLQKGESRTVSPDQVPAHIREKILAEQRRGGRAGFGGIIPPQGRGPQWHPQPQFAPQGGYPPQGGVWPQQGQVRPRGYDSFGPMPEYVPRIPRGMNMWEAHRRGYW